MEVIFAPKALEDLKYWKKSGNKIIYLSLVQSIPANGLSLFRWKSRLAWNTFRKLKGFSMEKFFKEYDFESLLCETALFYSE